MGCRTKRLEDTFRVVKRRVPFLLCLLAAFIFAPQVAQANAGTPLIWAGMLHLIFGNAIIGLGEGALIAWIFKLPMTRCQWLMIAANYFSAWIGGWILAGKITTWFDWNLYNAWTLFWLFVLAAYLMTILLELPFIVLCFHGRERLFRSSLKASLIAQTVSYLCIFGWYWGATGKSLYTRMEIVPASEIRLPENLNLYHISSQDGRVHNGPTVIGPLVSSTEHDRLIILPVADATNTWELALLSEGATRTNTLPIQHPISGRLASEERPDGEGPSMRMTSMNFGKALRMSDEAQSDWSVRTGFWPIEGMRLKNTKTGQELRFAWETPFSQWNVRNAVHLPDDHVIFQLGSDQICVLEPATRRIALLARGYGPAVIWK